VIYIIFLVKNKSKPNLFYGYFCAMRFLMYAILFFLIYLYFIKPFVNGISGRNNRNYKKANHNPTPSGHNANETVADNKGEYIEFEEINDD
jgi:hypothetical protein